MRRVVLAALAAALCGVACASPGIPERPPLLIGNVTVVDLERDRQFAPRWVVVRDGRIAAIHTEAPTIADAVQVDGTGRFLVPGLAEMHAHLPSPGQGKAYRDRVLFLYLAAGVTTVRGMLGDRAHLDWREQVASYDLLGPRIYTSGPSFNGGSVRSARQAAKMVRAQHAAGYDFLKLHPGLELEEFEAIAATANEVGIPFAGHVSAPVGLERALAARQATIDHLDAYMQALVPVGSAYADRDVGFFGYGIATLADAELIPRLAGRTAQAGVWNVPTQTLIENVLLPPDADALAARPEMAWMPAATVADWHARKREAAASPDYDPAQAERFVRLRRALIRALHQAGAGLLLGSDAPQIFNVPGFAAHRELAALVAAGLTPREALLTGTRNPAVFFGAEDTFGRIEVGLEADLILLRADPRDDIAAIGAIEGVVARGRWLSRAAIDERLAHYGRN